MSWLSELFFGQGVAHSVLMFAIVIALGDRAWESENLGSFVRNNLDSFCWDYLQSFRDAGRWAYVAFHERIRLDPVRVFRGITGWSRFFLLF